MKFLILLLILMISYVKSDLTSQEVQDLITYHNNLRSNPSPAAAQPLSLLTYDYNIAAVLQTNLDTCQGKWSPLANQGLVSEWQYWWSPVSYFTIQRQMDFIAKQNENYDWNSLNCKPQTTCLPWLFMVWSTSTKFGCAKSICGDQTQMTCAYQYPGGYAGVAPYTLASSTPAPTTTPAPTNTPAPTTNSDSVNWNSLGYVTPVRDQGQCGSCWTFGAIGTMESRYLIKNGNALVNTLDLSEQNALSCLPEGCNGGWHRTVLDTFKGSVGISYEADEPYQTKVGVCSYTSPAGKSRFYYNGYAGVSANDKQGLIRELKNGPLAVSLWVDDAFQSYRSGVFSCQTIYTNTNHIVLLVGYNADGDYWIIKNSWNTWWGESGYMRLTASNDNCYMLGYPSYFPIF